MIFIEEEHQEQQQQLFYEDTMSSIVNAIMGTNRTLE